ncbi:Nitric oxide-associated protein 1 [Taenia solium]|eukprot:TsM_000980800 transcript=TsM_000980800 gene=TsM_000980800
MIKSSILSYRTISACQLQAWLSLRPYTREQRLIKAVKKQEERLKRNNLRRQDYPIVFQSQIDAKSLTPAHSVASSSLGFKPRDSSEPPRKQLLDHETLNRIYNLSENTNYVVLNTLCAGCGAKLHCGTPGTHGFLPEPEIIKLKSSEQPRRGRKRATPLPVVCLRCQLVAQYETALKESLPSEEYEKQVITELNNQSDSTILLVTDMTNLPHSIVPLRLTNPSGHRIVLIGNKVDQLPIDGPKFHSRWCEILLNAFTETSGLQNENVSHVALISALTGYGVQKLLDFLLSKRFNVFESPVYIVGSTNTGKSSLFNRLLLSDFCKSDARETIHRATVSLWPGTTAGLLKFPLARMSYVKRALREQAKYTEEHSTKKSTELKTRELYGYMVVRENEVVAPLTSSNIDAQVERVRNVLQDLSAKPTYRYRRDASGADVIEESDMGLRRLFQEELGVEATLETNQDTGNRLLISGTIDPRHFNPRAWCYDTPGLESSQQSLNFLSNDQLMEYVSLISGRKSDFHRPERRFLLPRTFVLRPGLTMLLGRLGRLDVLASKGPVYLTTQTRLPVHIVETSDVDIYCDEYANFLGPGGSCNATRTSDDHSIPPMIPVVLKSIQPVDLEQSVADVVLSGAGWVSVSGVGGEAEKKTDNEAGEETEEDYGISLRAWTPGGVGVSVRQPPLLPYAIRRRGERLLYLREYSGLSANAPFAQFSPS